MPDGLPRISCCACQCAESSAVDAVIPQAPDLGGHLPRTSWNSTSLAFLGDAVWEVRTIACLIISASSVICAILPSVCPQLCTSILRIKHAPFLAAVQLYVRRHCFMPPQRVTTYYERVVAQVRAEQQVTTCQCLQHAGCTGWNTGEPCVPAVSNASR